MKNRMRPELIIAIAALVISIIATFASIYFSRVSLKTDVLPVLVFVWDQGQGWRLRNVGNGPALNVVVASKCRTSPGWEHPTRLYPLSEGEEVRLAYVGPDADWLGVAYSDAHNRYYTSICDEDLSVVHSGRKLPKWKKTEIRRIWERNVVCS